MSQTHHAAEYGLTFGELPPPLRVVGGKAAAKTEGRAPRPRRPDYVAPPSHRPHGTYVKYVVERCTCEPCRAANRAYELRRQHAIHRPDEVWLPYVPAGRARAHVAELRAAGVGLKQVAKASGLPHGGLSKLVYGDPARGMAPSRRIRPTTEAAILAVTVAAVADGGRVPAGPTWALLDDLIARGFTKTWLAGQLGQKGPALQLSRNLVSGRHVRAVADLHARLESVTGPGRRSRWDR